MQIILTVSSLALVLLRIRPDNEDLIDMGRFLDIIDRTTADPKLAYTVSTSIIHPHCPMS